MPRKYLPSMWIELRFDAPDAAKTPPRTMRDFDYLILHERK